MLKEKLAFLKIAAQVFEAEDFFNIFLRFLGFRGSFSYKKSVSLGRKLSDVSIKFDSGY